MKSSVRLEKRRQELVEELDQLVYVRRGSVVEQRVKATDAQGHSYERGPYPIYSFKERGKTVSRRLHDQQQVQRYRQQIHDGRRFQEVVAELLRVGEALSDVAMETDTVKKTPHSP